MKPSWWRIFGLIWVEFVLGVFAVNAQQLTAMPNDIPLPTPQLKGNLSVEQAISERRSQRRFSLQELTQEQVSQLLWSAQGITQKHSGLRAAPSAGGLYPTEIYLLSKDGLFHYSPQGHKLEQLRSKDLRGSLAQAALGQNVVAQAPVVIVIAAVYARVTSRYGARGARYTDIEVGHVAQNIHLQAQALGLGSVPVGAFDDREVKELLRLADEQQPLYIIPVGYPR